MIQGNAKPPHVVITLPNREPYIVWDEKDAIEMLYEMLEAIKVFPGAPRLI